MMKSTIASLPRFKTFAVMASMALSASAFALTPGSGTWVKESNLFGLQDAQTYVPKNTNPATIGNGRALMLTLHGCGQTASGNVINKMFNWEATAEQYGMVVVAPTVPSGTTSTRTIAGCWDWFGSGHTRTTRDEGILLKLIDAIKSRSNLDIDPNQIYVSGLSSGGGVTVTLGCVAPDYFAGVAANAAPEMNTPANAGVGSKLTQTPQQISDNCKSAAGSYVSYFNTQILSVVNGDADTMVDPSHDQGIEDGQKILYGATTAGPSISDVKTTGDSWKDGNGNLRVEHLTAQGMTHAWPAGAGGSGGGTYVDYTHVNYPVQVTKYFFDNNLRVSRGGTTTTTSTSSTSTSSTSTSSTSTTSTSTTSSSTTTSSTTTTTAPSGSGSCFTSSNATHVLMGRAHLVYTNFHAAANGSNQDMGMYSMFVTTTLKQIGVNNYVIGTCQ